VGKVINVDWNSAINTLHIREFHGYRRKEQLLGVIGWRPSSNLPMDK